MSDETGTPRTTAGQKLAAFVESIAPFGQPDHKVLSESMVAKITAQIIAVENDAAAALRGTAAQADGGEPTGLSDRIATILDHYTGPSNGYPAATQVRALTTAIRSELARGAQADTAPGGGLDVERLRAAIYEISQRHDWEHTTDREDRTEEIAAEYTRLAAEASLLALAARLAAEPVAAAAEPEYDPQDNRWDLAAKAQRDGDHAEPPVTGAARQAGGGS